MGLRHRNKFLLVSKPLNFDHVMHILKEGSIDKVSNRQAREDLLSTLESSGVQIR
jgi:hypothetical protein